MSLDLTIQNRQRTRAINSRQLRQVTAALLNDLLEVQQAELGITLVAAPEMTQLNERFLQHEGSTDVITFDYREPESRNRELGTVIRGEVFICIDEAIVQARRFRTTWQAEVVRYIIHGVLHLLGQDDQGAADRREMKREENRLLRALGTKCKLQSLRPRR